ncbi:MAG: phage head-tail connector protein [Lachnospiraceae bacterium]|nr:phage head-tail connector protein [Lachnospiraceae bacterium]
MTLLEKLKKLTGESDEELLSILLELSKDTILELTNRKEFPQSLETTQLKMAVIAYNRLGTEGETSRSEGGISSAFADMPTEILSAIKGKRLGKVGGHIYEQKNDTEAT